MKFRIFIFLAGLICSFALYGQFGSDVIKTSEGNLKMIFIGHGTLKFEFNGKVIHIDPTLQEPDYVSLPDADLILVTHQHGDHLDLAAINQLMKENTSVVMTPTCLEQLKGFNAIVMENGDQKSFYGLDVRAIPAYNIAHVRSNGKPYHPKGEGNGYILSFGTTHVLIGGDTENIPEYHDLNLPIMAAFLPMNLPFTMTPEMVADAALTIRPRYLYPYHYNQTDPNELVELLKDEPGIEVRIRDLK